MVLIKFIVCNILILITVNAQSNSWSRGSTDTDCCEDYCYANDQDPYLLFGTKTAYEFVHGRNSRQHLVPQCRPVQFWSVNRHGARLPNEKTIRKLSTYLPKLRKEIIDNFEVHKNYPENGRMCFPDFSNLKQWSWDTNITVEHANWLTNQGKDDMKYLAKRYQTRFPNLLGLQYNEQDYVFKYTDVERIESSYRSFIEGLFNRDAYLVQGSPMSLNDSVLENYKTCSSFDYEKDKYKNEDSEANKFMQKPIFQNMIQHISIKLGFRYTLNFTSIQMMYDMCRYEKAWRVRFTSPWCAVFTKDQLKIMEYLEDLKSYYSTGYGNEISQKIGCAGVKELLSYFEKVSVNEPNQPKSVIYFTHRQTIQMLLVALNFTKDHYPLTADNYEGSRRRQWQISRITPFAANLAAVFYECPKLNQKHVMFFLNENPVDHPDCNVGLCNWDVVYKRLKPLAENCDLDFCDDSSANRIYHNLLLTVVIVTVIKYIL